MSGGTPPSIAWPPAAWAAASTSLTPMMSISSNGPDLPAKPPPHHAIDVVNGMGNLRRDAGGIDQRGRQRGAKELAGLVFRVEERANAVGQVVDRLTGFDRGDPGGLFRPVSSVAGSSVQISLSPLAFLRRS